MFRFLFKRSQKSVAPPDEKVLRATVSVPDRATERQMALDRARSFGGREDAAVAFILECPFADARLVAAEALQAPAHLSQVRQAMRDTDRRVARLMQSRLDEWNQRLEHTRLAEECLHQATALLDRPRLLASDVAELDRRWQALPAFSGDIHDAFATMRQRLAARLKAQAGLQRQLIDIAGRLRAITSSLADADAPAADPALLPLLTAEIDDCRASSEALSVPASLFSSVDNALADCLNAAAQASEREMAAAQREAVLARWEAAEPSLLDAVELRRQWADLPLLNDPARRQRFDILIERVRVAQVAKAEQARQAAQSAQAMHALPSAPLPVPEAAVKQPEIEPSRIREFEEALAALDEALENGLLQAALAQDRTLRALGMAIAAGTPDRSARLSASRARLARLQGWARWGGNVSRDELLKAAQELPALEKDLRIVAERVGDLRRRWKALDRSAGPPAQQLWEQFDAACTVAYAPAAAHFAAQAAERDANRIRAEELIAALEASAQKNGLFDASLTDGEPPAWKDIARFCRQSEQAWQEIGPVGRREKKALQARFDVALAHLRGPLLLAQQEAATQREAMIMEVLAIDPLDRHPGKRLRAIQERWQEHARSLPLAGNQESVLWQRFRDACDQVHSRRQASLETAKEAERHARDLRQALCEMLESAINGPQDRIEPLLEEIAVQWNNAGSTPGPRDRAVAARYQQAVAALQQRLDEAHRRQSDTLWDVLHERLALCREAEQAVLAQSLDDGVRQRLESAWKTLPALDLRFNQALQHRFEQAMAPGDGRETYAALLRHNEQDLLTEVLRLEILSGPETPATLSQERLRLQVDMLRSTLKNGRTNAVLGEHLVRLCGLAALTDDHTARRIDGVFRVVRTTTPILLGSARSPDAGKQRSL